MLGGMICGNALLQWERDELLGKVWSGQGSMSIFPEYPDTAAPDLWNASGLTMPWRSMRRRIAALVALMSRWPGCPQELMVAKDAVVDMDDRSEFGNFVANVIDFYFRTFTTAYGRLPIVPAEPPLFRG